MHSSRQSRPTYNKFMTEKLKIIRMSPAALAAIADENTETEFWSRPTNPTTNRKACVTFTTPTGKYWAVAPPRYYWGANDVYGVTKRLDGRWCWMLSSHKVSE